MIVECWAILAVLTMMLYMFISRGKASTALSILPLMILPFVHLAGGPLSRFLSGYIPLPAMLLHVALDVLAVVIACSIVGGMSRSIKRKSARRSYAFLSCGFTVVLAWVLIFDILHYLRSTM